MDSFRTDSLGFILRLYAFRNDFHSESVCHIGNGGNNVFGLCGFEISLRHINVKLYETHGHFHDVYQVRLAFSEIVECNHTPKVLKDVWSREEYPLDWLSGKTVCTLSGIASPKGFENSLRHLGAKVVWCERYADHHRYDSSEVLYALNRTADMGADALVTTEKDAVRFPRLETTPVRCLYLRIAIEILAGGESFTQLINRICFRK